MTTAIESQLNDAETGGRTLDDLADAIVVRFAEFVGECAASDKFAGFAIDQARDEDGTIQAIRFVACDQVGEDVVRRAAK